MIGIRKRMSNPQVDHKNNFIQSRMSVRSNQVITFIRDIFVLPLLSALPVLPIGVSLPFNILEHHHYDQLYPRCEMMPNILNNTKVDNRSTIYIKKFQQLLPTNQTGSHGPRKMVAFLVTLDDMDGAVDSFDEFLRYIRTFNEWISFSICYSDRIVNIKTNDMVRLSNGRFASARRCGMASLLAYLCFLDTDHLTNVKGFMISEDLNWWDGNMISLSGLFNNRICNVIIKVDPYVSYRVVTTPQFTQDRYTWPGNKAIIYGAVAAGFYNLVTYNPDPCRPQPPNQPRHLQNICCLGNEQKGNAFLTTDLVDSINVRQPNPAWNFGRPNPLANLPIGNFMQHYGRHWYFCKLT